MTLHFWLQMYSLNSNISPSSVPRSSKCPLSFRFWNQNFTLVFPCTPHAPNTVLFSVRSSSLYLLKGANYEVPDSVIFSGLSLTIYLMYQLAALCSWLEEGALNFTAGVCRPRKKKILLYCGLQQGCQTHGPPFYLMLPFHWPYSIVARGPVQCRRNFGFNPLNAELNPICYLLALLGAHHFLHVSRIRVKSLILRLLMSYICGAPVLDVSRSHTTTQHSR